MPDPASTPTPPAPFDPARPLGPIAISLSGGGYRAAAFHLGTLRLLDRVNLLNSVVGLSTVSGGTICGMAWVVSRIDGKSFGEFYDGFAKYLVQNNVIAQALDGLTGDRDHGSTAWASLIRSAADVYARPELFGDRRFGEVLGARGLGLQEAIFNSTEFHTGLDFRFRRSDDEHAPLGNRNYPLAKQVAQNIRLADVVAASSCFPGGFEPIVFPQQFHWPESYPLDEALNDLGPQYSGGLPLMDGGIYDNQGVDSLLLAYDKSDACTLLISDVSAQNNEMYAASRNPTRRGWITLNGVKWAGWGLFALVLAAAVVLFLSGFEAADQGNWTVKDYFLYLVPGLLTAAVAGGLIWMRRRLADVNRLLEQQVDVHAWRAFRKLTVLELMQMLMLRGTSLMALTSSIFMKRVRGLIYSRVYEDPKFAGRRMSNMIYKLANDYPDLYEAHPWIKPRPHLVSLGQQAEQMPTTLWFTEEKQFTLLSNAGEATVCFVLLRYLVENHAGRYEKEGLPLFELYTRLRQEWDVFQRDAVRMPASGAAAAAPLATTAAAATA